MNDSEGLKGRHDGIHNAKLVVNHREINRGSIGMPFLISQLVLTRKSEKMVVLGFQGLIVYGIESKQELQDISDVKKKEFRDVVTAKVVPKAVCDFVFTKYVHPPRNN